MACRHWAPELLGNFEKKEVKRKEVADGNRSILPALRPALPSVSFSSHLMMEEFLEGPYSGKLLTPWMAPKVI